MSSLQRGVNLKDEEEVKQYLENLGTEYRFSCYYEKNPSGPAKTRDILIERARI